MIIQRYMGIDLLTFLAIGFVAQLVDRALGMAFGIISTTALLSVGQSRAHASAAGHTAEVFTTGSSAVSPHHPQEHALRLVTNLAVAGSIGAIIGASRVLPKRLDYIDKEDSAFQRD